MIHFIHVYRYTYMYMYMYVRVRINRIYDAIALRIPVLVFGARETGLGRYPAAYPWLQDFPLL